MGFPVTQKGVNMLFPRQFEYNGDPSHISINSVILNPGALPTDRYKPPTKNWGIPLGYQLTWPAVVGGTVGNFDVVATGVDVTTGDDNLYPRAEIKADDDTQNNPWFEIVSISVGGGDSTITCRNVEGRAVGAGTKDSSILLDGSGVTVGHFDSGMPAAAFADWATYVYKTRPLSFEAFHCAQYRLWNFAQDYHPDPHAEPYVPAFTAVANNENLYEWHQQNRQSVPECGGAVGVNCRNPALTEGEPQRVWDNYQHAYGAALLFNWDDRNRSLPDSLVSKAVTYLAFPFSGNYGGIFISHPDLGTPIPLADAYTLQTAIDRYIGGLLPYLYPLMYTPTVIPLASIRFDDEPDVWFKVLQFQRAVLTNLGGGLAQLSNPTITIMRCPLDPEPTLAPTGTAKKISSNISGGQPFTPRHTKTIYYRAENASEAITALKHAIDDNIQVAKYSQFTYPSSSPVFKALKKAAKKLSKNGTYLVLNGVQYRFGADYRYPIIDSFVSSFEDYGISIGGNVCKDYNPLSDLSRYVPDESKPTQVRQYNMHREPLSITSHTSINGGQYQDTILGYFGRKTDCFVVSEPVGGFDLRYASNPQSQNMVLTPSAMFLPTFGQLMVLQDFDMLMFGPHMVGAPLPASVAGNFTTTTTVFLMQAWKRKTGSFPKLSQITSWLRRGAWLNTGPSTDLRVFPQQYRSISKGTFVYPETATQTVFPPLNADPYLYIQDENGDLQRVNFYRTGDSTLLDAKELGMVQDTQGDWDGGLAYRSLVGRGHLNVRRSLDLLLADVP